ncbi:putative membrane protein [Candidatus Phytoplasma solani]
MVTKFFPELAAKFGGAFKNLKDTCHNINDKTAEALEKIGISPQYSSVASKALWLIGGCLLAGACCFIPFVGPLIGSLVLVATITYVSITSLTDKTPQTPPTNNSPPQQLENKNENPKIENKTNNTQHHEEPIETNNNDEPQQKDSQKNNKKKQTNLLN